MFGHSHLTRNLKDLQKMLNQRLEPQNQELILPLPFTRTKSTFLVDMVVSDILDSLSKIFMP